MSELSRAKHDARTRAEATRNYSLPDHEQEAEFQRRFKLTCRACGSDDVVMSFQAGFGGSEVTAADPGDIVFGCNACKQNDLFMSLFY